jgi:hypothetical protein
MFTRIRIHPTLRIAAAAALAVAACAAISLIAGSAPAEAGKSSSKSVTLRVYDKPTQIVVTQPDGTVIDEAPYPEPQPGQVLDVYADDFAGTFKKHSRKPIGSSHLRCVFAEGPPACENHVELGDGLMVFKGPELVAGTRRYRGATGRIVSNRTISQERNDSEAVVKLRLR